VRAIHWRQRSGAGNALEGFGAVTLAEIRRGQCTGGRDQVRAMHWRQRSGAGNALEAEIRCGQCTGGRDQVQAMHWRGLDL